MQRNNIERAERVRVQRFGVANGLWLDCCVFCTQTQGPSVYAASG